MSEKFVYTPEDLADFNYENDLGNPGEYPFTRGTRQRGYQEKLWTMRQFSGFGSAEDTNQRYKKLLAEGETGLSVAFDMPTLLGYDSDHPKARWEIGKEGVAIDSLEDMEILFKDIPLGKITTSMTINAPAAVLLAMYIVVAEKQGVSKDKIGGTIQNDILKEYIAQNEWIFPPEPSMRLIVDTIEYCTKFVPHWNTISISGYHIREAGATAVQELAFTLADGITYVESCLQRGISIDDFAPRFSFFFNFHNDFFEEIAKIRAARYLWAHIMKEKFGAQNPRSWMCRIHIQPAGCTLTGQQPLNNIARVALQALGAVLAGIQSLHTNSYDEELCLPSEEAVRVALRTQQIIAYETGVVDVVDPLAGSYYVEFLTKKLIREAQDYIKRIDEMGGMIKAIEQGFPQREIGKSAWEYQKSIETKERVTVGVNKFAEGEEREGEFEINPQMQKLQLKRLKAFRQKRNKALVQNSLAQIKKAAEGNENLMPYFIEAVKSSATLGEICEILKSVFGEYRERVSF
jgi:methylmalonyl-CoA mutase N-terminal domain/subunit